MKADVLPQLSKASLLLLLPLLQLSACDRVKQQAKHTISKTGETIGQSASEFAGGVSEGVDKAFHSELALSRELQDRGLSTGKFKIRTEGQAHDHILTAYLIFARDFRDTVQVRVLDSKGQEYGRTRQAVAGRRGEAHYVDFIFDPRTEIEARSKFMLEQH